MVRIKRVTKQGFTTVNNKWVAQNAQMSLQARGLFLYLWSLPEDWDFYETEIVKHATNGKAATKTALEELEKLGFLIRSRARNEKGQLKGTNWIIRDYPALKNEKPMSENRIQDKPMSDFPMLEKPTLEKPTLENQTLQNTNLTKEISNKEITKQNRVVKDKNKIPYDRIIDYLNRKTHRTGRNKFNSSTKEYQKLIRGRFSDGYEAEDFKQVIDNKCRQWVGTEMEAFLTPNTLFKPTTFETYLKQKTISPRQQNKQYKSAIDWQEKQKDTKPNSSAPMMSDEEMNAIFKNS